MFPFAELLGVEGLCEGLLELSRAEVERGIAEGVEIEGGAQGSTGKGSGGGIP